MTPQLRLFVSPDDRREPPASLSPNLTLREFFERHCVPKFHPPAPDPKVDGGREKTRRLYRDTRDKWERLTTNPPLGRIADSDCEAFLERVAKESGRRGPLLADHTVKRHAGHLRTLLRRAGPKLSDRRMRP